VAVSRILRSRLYGGERRELAGIGMRCVCPGSAVKNSHLLWRRRDPPARRFLYNVLVSPVGVFYLY
jgi:hypothetical protein